MKYSNQVEKLIEVYTCLQGEGKYAGVPHILIRTTSCNLNCKFAESMCDTAYASWFPEKGSLSLNDIEKLVLKNPQIKHAFITGGEPTVHPELLQNLVSLLKEHDYFVAIESNGTNFADISGLDFVTMSPKLSNSVPKAGDLVTDLTTNTIRTITQREQDKHEGNRKNYDNTKKMMERYDYQLKFVVSTEDQLQEIKELQQLLNAPNNKIYLMPEGVTAEQLQHKRQWLMELCVKEGYYYSDRLQIIAYGLKRGF